MAYRFRNMEIPDAGVQSALDYIQQGVPPGPGSFLEAVICNDLRESVGRADDYNIELIPAWVALFWNSAPAACWGSRAAMVAHLTKHAAIRAAKEKAVKPNA